MEKLIEFCLQNPNILKSNSVDVGNRFNLTQEEVLKLRQEVKCRKRGLKYEEKEDIADIADLTNKIYSKKENLQTGETTIEILLNAEPLDADEIIKFLKIDTKRYELKNYWSIWKSNKWHVSAFLKKKDDPKEQITDLLQDYVSSYKPLPKSAAILNDAYGTDKGKRSLVLNITDLHIDKLDLDNETIDERIEKVNVIIDELLFAAYRIAYLDEIVLILGSDFFNSDTFFNTTTNGTPQDNNAAFDRSFAIGFQFYEELIQKLTQFCDKLNVIYLPGNHDYTKSYYLAFGLYKFFSDKESVFFDINHSTRKSYTYGDVFIGFHHGNCKIEDLPLVFSRTEIKKWGNATHHYIMTGDKHFYMEKEIAGVRIVQSPSLSGTDRWHSDKNYVGNKRTVIGCLYHKETGRDFTIEKSIK